MTTTDRQKSRQRYQNAVNNAQGQMLERYIKAACEVYSRSGRAAVDKTPEPFRVTGKERNGIFTGRFTAHAQPDFRGTLHGGRSICFEAKYTSADRLKRGILTDTQISALALHAELGAKAGVCAGMGDKFYFIPWDVWRNMKERYGRQYVTAEDIEPYRVKFAGAVMFLDYITPLPFTPPGYCGKCTPEECTRAWNEETGCYAK
jgi:recombination protein U